MATVTTTPVGRPRVFSEALVRQVLDGTHPRMERLTPRQRVGTRNAAQDLLYRDRAMSALDDAIEQDRSLASRVEWVYDQANPERAKFTILTQLGRLPRDEIIRYAVLLSESRPRTPECGRFLRSVVRERGGTVTSP